MALFTGIYMLLVAASTLRILIGMAMLLLRAIGMLMALLAGLHLLFVTGVVAAMAGIIAGGMGVRHDSSERW